MRIGVDVGGTFTDLIVVSDGGFSLHKVPSTPADPGAAILQGVSELGIDLHNLALFAHGTTITTNAVIQRKGSRAGLLTTKGFRDVLQIRRTTRGRLYDFQWDPPAELVPRQWRREVPERTNASGAVTRHPDLARAVAEVRDLVEAGVDALAICFLNAYLNIENERAVRDAVHAAFPDLPIYISAEILPEWREFERTSTTCVSAYVGPVLSEYVHALETELADRGYRYDLMVMLSNGGLARAASATAQPGYTLVSGPAAGVVAQVALAETTGLRNLIGMDIGGTSTDISLIYDGEPYLKSEFELEFGTAVSYPIIDIDSIGAGGGTIAWLDPGGLLHSGPRSAGAQPGPVCMQLGGTEPTVTDANVVLHRLNPAFLLGGRIPISEAAAREAVGALGGRVRLDAVLMAQGILTLTTSNIVHAIRQRTIARGLDPREFALVAYGGAGPLHGVEVAAELGIPTVLVPRFPGLTSAMGLLFADVRHDLLATVLREATDVSADHVGHVYADLAEQGRTRMLAEDIPEDRMAFLYAAGLRYVGQTHELTVPLPGPYSSEMHEHLSLLLRDVHLREFGHAPDGAEPVEIVNVRVACLGRMERPPFDAIRVGPEPVPCERRTVWLHREWVETHVYERDTLRAEVRLRGPAIVEQLDSTTVIPPGWLCAVDQVGNLLITRM